MMPGADTIPGVLYRLTVFEATGIVADGYPKIYSTVSRIQASIRAQECNAPAGRTWTVDGCARGPWLCLDGPVVPDVGADFELEA